MFYLIKIGNLPKLIKSYQVERKTTWSIIEPENLLIIVTKGEGYFEINQKTYCVKENQAVFIPANTEYKRWPKEDMPATYFYIHFITETPPQELSHDELLKFLKKSNEHLYNCILDDSSSIYSAIEHLPIQTITVFNDDINVLVSKMQDTSISQHIENLFLTSVYFYTILGVCIKDSVKTFFKKNENHIAHSLSPKIQKAVIYINKNCNQDISLKELCEVCSVTPQHLIKLFKENLNTTPTQYINRLRINHAKSLIQNQPQLSMKEIAYSLGFENTNYFSRLFLNVAGITASDFRKKVSTPNKSNTPDVVNLNLESKT